MRKTALITAVLLAAALFVGLGSTWADEPSRSDEPRISDEIARRLAERLSGKEPGGANFYGPTPLRQRAQLPSSPPRSSVTPCLAQAGGADPDPCAVAREFSRMGPCADPGNCPAYETWRQLYGLEEPRIVPAEPAPPSRPALASTKDKE